MDEDSAFAEKARSINTPRKIGAVERTVERAGGSTVIHDTHWDGRVDATVRPATVEFETVIHKAGTKTGKVAEIRRKGHADR